MLTEQERIAHAVGQANAEIYAKQMLARRHQAYAQIVYEVIRDMRDGKLTIGVLTAGTLSAEDTTLLDTIMDRIKAFDSSGAV